MAQPGNYDGGPVCPRCLNDLPRVATSWVVCATGAGRKHCA